MHLSEVGHDRLLSSAVELGKESSAASSDLRASKSLLIVTAAFSDNSAQCLCLFSLALGEDDLMVEGIARP